MSWLRGIVLGLLAAAALAFFVGFWGFAHSVNRAAPPDPLPEADAVVALTGGSLERLRTGMDLLAAGHGRRLLISGVNPKVTDEELAQLLRGRRVLFECCVDIGRRAEDTLGNAAETAAWARRNGFETLIVVTEDYHMPRSITELRIAMPNVKLAPYPVSARISKEGVWQNDVGAAGRLGLEYVKYLIIRAREALIALDRRKAPNVAA
ncbi:MAG: YdcF family protein [Hyphomonadaceae bacterium]